MMQNHPSALLLAAQLLHVIAWPFLEPRSWAAPRSV